MNRLLAICWESIGGVNVSQITLVYNLLPIAVAKQELRNIT
jgi:hypothetical protein